jgi:exosome complex component RRP43
MDAFEEESCAERGCVVVDVERSESGEGNGGVVVKRIEKSGGGVVGVREVGEILKLAEGRWREWRCVLEKARKDAG